MPSKNKCKHLPKGSKAYNDCINYQGKFKKESAPEPENVPSAPTNDMGY